MRSKIYKQCVLILAFLFFAPLAKAADLPKPFSAEEFKKHVVFLAADELRGRVPGSEGSAKSLAYIREQFESSGLKPLLKDEAWVQQFPLNTPESSTGAIFAKNVIAVSPGIGALKDEAVIVCAHYDHIGVRNRPGEDDEDLVFNGADDNASGVAAILMMAQALKSRTQKPSESCRTVIFVSFDAEEQGLLGSRHYVQRPPWPLEKTVAVINFDGVGLMRREKLFATDAETNPILANTIREAARAQGIVAETRLGGHGRSDHVIFQRIGIPGVQFFTGASINYHQVTDEWETLNLEGGATIAWIGYQTLEKLMTLPGEVEFKKLNPTFSVQRAINLVRTLGIIPNVNAQQGKYPEILFVTPGSSAAKAGIKGGDKITALNGLKFNRVEDGLVILQQLSFDEGLRLEVLRGDKTVDLSIPAETFKRLSGPEVSPLENGKYRVAFRYEAGADVEKVYLSGEFNNWEPTAQSMKGPGKNGLFTATLELEAGAYEYKFVVEGTKWVSDPENLNRVGEHNNSVVTVGE